MAEAPGLYRHRGLYRVSTDLGLPDEPPLITGPALFPDYIFTRMSAGEDRPKSACRAWFQDNLFLFCTMLGVLAGILLGK